MSDVTQYWDSKLPETRKESDVYYIIHDQLGHPFKDISLPKQRNRITMGEQKSNGNSFWVPASFPTDIACWKRVKSVGNLPCLTCRTAYYFAWGREIKEAVDYKENPSAAPYPGMSSRASCSRKEGGSPSTNIPQWVLHTQQASELPPHLFVITNHY